MEKLIIYPGNEGYATNQCGRTLTVGDLIESLQNYDENTPVYFHRAEVWSPLYSCPLYQY